MLGASVDGVGGAVGDLRPVRRRRARARPRTPPSSTRPRPRCPAAATRSPSTSPTRPAGTTSRSPAETATTTSPSRPTGRGWRPTGRCRRCSSTSTGRGSTPASSAARACGTLSPLRAFLGRWGLTNADQNAADQRDHRRGPGEPAAGHDRQRPERRLRAAASSTAATTPTRSASRTSAGSSSAAPSTSPASPTIGIAQSIDPGNFDTEESALVLLDVLSDPAGEPGDPSLNTYLTPASNRIGVHRPGGRQHRRPTRPGTSSATGTSTSSTTTPT